ncbi:hypothetical protein GA0061101_121112 [Rhizobium lusitanum]|uniref:Uncharacterized protein n=1 Tax=Rhizobium lusitanum TaxID=293958 RepID=A0A1C3X0N0_9HYPH|nr:hypothetical protein GA0061101_121112 [Rhizobium lusitanum]
MLPLYQFEKQIKLKMVFAVTMITPRLKRTIGDRCDSIFAMPVDCHLDRFGFGHGEPIFVGEVIHMGFTT